MKYVDLFCGAGGLSLGFKNAGLELVFANEFDSHACNTYRKNLDFLGDDPDKMIEGPIEELHQILSLEKQEIIFSNSKIHDSGVNKSSYKKAKSVDENQIKQALKTDQVDFVIGGPPCQGFSNAGRGKKSASTKNYKEYIDDPRNHLFKYFLGFVSRFNPKIVLIENVKGLSSSSNYKNIIQNSLENTGNGYISLSKVLNSADFGVPQSRERIFFIGVRKDLSEADEFIFWLNNLLTYHKEEIVTTRDAIEDLPQIISNPKPLNTKTQDEIPIGKEGSFGETISSKNYDELIINRSKYVNSINKFNNQNIFPNKLYNHKTRFNNKEDLKIYSLMKVGKYIDHPDNYEALKLCKYGTQEIDGKVTISGFADKYYKLHS